MIKLPLSLLFCLLWTLALAGCGLARVDEELLPGCQHVAPIAPVLVEVYEQGISSPTRSTVPVANLNAHGNGYATKDVLVTALRKHAAEIGAELIVIGVVEVANGPLIVSYGNGVAVADTVKLPNLKATAYRWAPARLGFRWNASMVIADIVPGTPAASSGLKIGDRLLAVNSWRVTGDYMAMVRAISSLQPGQAVTVEYARPDNAVRTITMIAAENR